MCRFGFTSQSKTTKKQNKEVWADISYLFSHFDHFKYFLCETGYLDLLLGRFKFLMVQHVNPEPYEFMKILHKIWTGTGVQFLHGFTRVCVHTALLFLYGLALGCLTTLLPAYLWSLLPYNQYEYFSIEILQNCIIFADKTHHAVTDKEVRDDAQIHIKNGEPLIFGKEHDKGIRLNGTQLEVVTIGENGITEDDLLVHDQYQQDRSSAAGTASR